MLYLSLPDNIHKRNKDNYEAVEMALWVEHLLVNSWREPEFDSHIVAHNHPKL